MLISDIICNCFGGIMNKVVKDDLMAILKTYYHTKKQNIKESCAIDFALIQDIMRMYSSDNKIPIMPDEMEKDYIKAHKNKEQEHNNIKQQIIDNIPLLEHFYLTLLDEFSKYEIDYTEYDSDDGCINLDMYYDFFKDYPKFNELLHKIVDTGHLYYVSNTDSSNTCILFSIDEEYIFINVDRVNTALYHLPHELGHVYQGKMKYSNNISGYDFLSEFISLLMEHLFINYYQKIDYKTSQKMQMNKLHSIKTTIDDCLTQLELLREMPEAFDGIHLKEEYRETIESMTDPNEFHFMLDNLYINFYIIDFLVAINYFYQVKYGVDFNEVDKVYIQNSVNNNLSSLLNNHVDLEAVKQYLRDYLPKKKINKKGTI